MIAIALMKTYTLITRDMVTNDRLSVTYVADMTPEKFSLVHYLTTEGNMQDDYDYWVMQSSWEMLTNEYPLFEYNFNYN